MVAKESHVRMIGYGAMLMESFVAISALIAACVIDPGLYYAINSPLGATGGDPATASEFVNTLGFTIGPDALAAAAQSVDEATLISRTGGAPTLAFGISKIFSEAFGGGLAAFWYHFAIMFEALFILTAVDAGTRVGRFIMQDVLGAVWAPFGRTSWAPSAWAASVLVCLGWGYFLYIGVLDPNGGINILWPLFGMANQMLAAIALAVVTAIFVKSGRLRHAWVPGLPLAWLVTVTTTAAIQKIGSDDPRHGFFAAAQDLAARLASGMLPIALAFGEGAEIQAPLARVVLGGLLISTLITLFLLPVLYLITERRKLNPPAGSG
jgi:carbon starvation protein